MVWAAAPENGFEIVGAVAGRTPVEPHGPLAGAGTAPPGRVDGPDRLPELLAGADLYLSAAPAEAERRNLPRVASAGIPAVVATTGFRPEDDAWIDEVSRRIPLLLESNFSVGVRMLARALSAVRPIPAGFDLSLIEAHRRGKRDRPSGTALELARRIPSAAPDGATVEITSLRAGELPGIHQIWITGPHELLRLEHLVLDRAAFADGMLWAARRLWDRRSTLTARRYTLDELWGPAEEA